MRTFNLRFVVIPDCPKEHEPIVYHERVNAMIERKLPKLFAGKVTQVFVDVDRSPWDLGYCARCARAG